MSVIHVAPDDLRSGAAVWRQVLIALEESAHKVRRTALGLSWEARARTDLDARLEALLQRMANLHAEGGLLQTALLKQAELMEEADWQAASAFTLGPNTSPVPVRATVRNVDGATVAVVRFQDTRLNYAVGPDGTGEFLWRSPDGDMQGVVQVQRDAHGVTAMLSGNASLTNPQGGQHSLVTTLSVAKSGDALHGYARAHWSLVAAQPSGQERVLGMTTGIVDGNAQEVSGVRHTTVEGVVTDTGPITPGPVKGTGGVVSTHGWMRLDRFLLTPEGVSMAVEKGAKSNAPLPLDVTRFRQAVIALVKAIQETSR